MEYLLAIESTCDESAAAVIRSDGVVVADSVASQEDLHAPFQGVVPEIAARAHLQKLLPIIEVVLRRSGIQPQQLAAVAVATEPGLPGSLLVGLCIAKALCVAWSKPLVAINHLQAHIYACQMGRSESIYPCVGFVVSGGHTHLYRCHTPLQWEFLGGTIDDAAGEAFDKVGVMLGLPFPGGPQLSKLGEQGDPAAFEFPRPMLSDQNSLSFSFSGLKTAVRYKLYGSGSQALDPSLIPTQMKANVAASFEQAVIDCLIGKCLLAIRRSSEARLCVGGGVAANQRFRTQLRRACELANIELLIADSKLCTDNAVMGGLAWESLRSGMATDLGIDICAGLVR